MISRLCIGVKDVYETVKRMENDFEMHPIADPVCDRPGSPDEKTGVNSETEVVIVAYRDASSGIMLELVSLNIANSQLMKIGVNLVVLVTSLKFPLFVHANVNVSNYGNGKEAYGLIGYTEIQKHYYGKV